jgi:hypothetical protein
MGFKKNNTLFLPIISLLAVGAVSTMLSIDPVTSFLGSHKRYDGLLSLMVYAFVFYMVVTHINRNRIDLFISIIIATATIICVYGLCQYYGTDYIWSMNFGYGGRIFGTMGHPAFLSAYLIMILPLLYYRIIGCNGYLIYLWYFLLMLLVVTFYMTKTRAGFAGFVISNICFFALIGYRNNRVKIAVILLIIVGISVVFGFKANSPIKRAVSDIGITAENTRIKLSGTVYTRWQTAQIAIDVIRDRPYFGIGYDCFGTVYPYYLMEYLKKHKDATVAQEIQDRVHQDVLDVAVKTGIIGLCVYLWFVFSYVRLYVGSKRTVLATAILAGICAYVVQCQASFGHVPILTMYWVLLGFLVIECRIKGV